MREGDATGWLHGNYNQGIAPRANPINQGGKLNERQQAQQVAQQVLGRKIVPANGGNAIGQNQFWKFDGIINSTVVGKSGFQKALVSR